jgi:hypothetical protein
MAMVDQARRDPVSVKMLKTNGDRIMDKYGEKPGKRLGYVLHALLEEVLEEPGKNDEKYLETRVFELLKLPELPHKELAEAVLEKQASEEAAALKAIAKTHKVG